MIAGLRDWALAKAFRIERINGDGACEPYLYRWTLARAFGCAVYLHRFVADDWSTDFHDHPRRFVSIGLWGGYAELTPIVDERSRGIRIYQAPWVRSFPAEHQHRVIMFRDWPPRGELKAWARTARVHECWTLVLVGRLSRPWGFWHEGAWIPWRQYVEDKGLVESVKSCQ